MTNVYLISYHSEPGQDLEDATGRFADVERAIVADEFPYDNGDDPSFYVARQRGRLTWGVCRPNVRTQLRIGDIVVFFSFTTWKRDERFVIYRAVAVATVEEKLDHRRAFTDPRLSRSEFINTLIRPEDGSWRYDETNRHKQARHSNWFWRMADQQRLSADRFYARYSSIYAQEGFTDKELKSRMAPLTENYILFSRSADKSLIARVPPVVAKAEKGKVEIWSHASLRRLTIDVATKNGSGHDYLRTKGRGYVHPPIRFSMESAAAAEWRSSLISELSRAATPSSHQPNCSPKAKKSSKKGGRKGCGS